MYIDWGEPVGANQREPAPRVRNLQSREERGRSTMDLQLPVLRTC